MAQLKQQTTYLILNNSFQALLDGSYTCIEVSQGLMQNYIKVIHPVSIGNKHHHAAGQSRQKVAGLLQELHKSSQSYGDWRCVALHTYALGKNRWCIIRRIERDEEWCVWLSNQPEGD